MQDTSQMEKYAFCMQLNAGQVAEYQRRHDEIWPELSELLKEAGIVDYSLHLHPETLQLFGVLWRRKDHAMDRLPEHPVMQKWWAYMAELMQVNPDNSPVVHDLQPMFHLP